MGDEITAYSDREYVLSVHRDAFCETSQGTFLVRRQESAEDFRSLLCLTNLSSRHASEQEAWACAADRLRTLQRTKDELESNISAVTAVYKHAFCSQIHRGHFQIRRPRVGGDANSHYKYVSLSGRFSRQELAWQDAAQRLRKAAELPTHFAESRSPMEVSREGR